MNVKEEKFQYFDKKVDSMLSESESMMELLVEFKDLLWKEKQQTKRIQEKISELSKRYEFTNARKENAKLWYNEAKTEEARNKWDNDYLRESIVGEVLSEMINFLKSFISDDDFND